MLASLSVDRGFACARVASGGSRFRLCARRFRWIEVRLAARRLSVDLVRLRARPLLVDLVRLLCASGFGGSSATVVRVAFCGSSETARASLSVDLVRLLCASGFGGSSATVVRVGFLWI